MKGPPAFFVPDKKRRHHHVWQEYLKAWSSNGQINCLMNERLFPTGTTQIAVESYFYKLGELTPDDIALIRFLVIDVEGLHPLTRKNHEDFLEMMIAPTAFEGMSAEVDAMIDVFRCNALEDYHASIEGSFLPLLRRALAKDISFYADDDSCITLCSLWPRSTCGPRASE